MFRYLISNTVSVEYWVYDFPSCPDRFSIRNLTLQSVFSGYLPFWLKFVRTDIASSEARVPYENKRTWVLLKHKHFEDAEWTILGSIEGKGNRAGTVGKMCFKTFDGETFDSNVKGCHKWLRQLWADRERLVGKLATIRYPNLTPAGKPRHGFVTRIRDYE